MGDDVKPADILGLAERCEQAAGADRELDCAIAEATGFRDRPGTNGATGRYQHNWTDRKGVFVEDVPEFTASIDAAMTLVPEGWSVKLCIFPAPSPTMATVGHDKQGYAATPALALTAAALRARAAILGDDKC